jgi:hypothetical protein
MHHDSDTVMYVRDTVMYVRDTVMYVRDTVMYVRDTVMYHGRDDVLKAARLSLSLD